MAPPAKPQKLDLSAGVVDQTQPIDLSSGFDNSPHDERNAAQKYFDRVTESKPLDFSSLSSGLNSTLGNIGAGLDSLATPIFHPIETAKSVAHLASLTPESAAFDPMIQNIVSSHLKSPEESTGDYTKRLGGEAFSTAGNMIGGAGMAEALPKVFAKIPSAGRATRTLEEIRNTARDVPVETTATRPAVQEFKGYLDTGGRPSRPVASLSRRVAPATTRQIAASEAKGPMMFPEARDFYTNISRASARPGVFRRAIESPELPQQRLNIGKVREAMNSDLTNAADQIGRGEDYQNALKEYANAKKIQKVARGVALLGAGEAARRTGLLGNWIHRTALQQ